MKIGTMKKTFKIFGLKQQEINNDQQELNGLIENIFIPRLSVPLYNNNISLLKNNIRIVQNDVMNLNNYKFKNLQSTKLIYTIVSAVNKIINFTNINASLENSNSTLLNTLNSYTSQTTSSITSIAKTNASINQEYLIYIQRFGIPSDGIFDTIKLNDIKYELTTLSNDYAFL